MINRLNRIQWKKDDVVIHDADEKIPLYLMIIVESVTKSNLFKTKYINMPENLAESGPFLNHIDFLLDPAMFGMDVTRNSRSRHKKAKYSKTLEDYRD